jgi:lysine 6-dehydrogenase
MRVLVVGVGLQGRAVVHDLESSARVDDVVAADLDRELAAAQLAALGCRKARPAAVDVSRPDELRRFVQQTAPDIVACMVPPALQVEVARAALEANAHFVSTSYTGGLTALAGEARARGRVLLPEMGFDPGIDLVLARSALEGLDEVHGLHMYGGGIPEAAAADNPLRYKVTWTFDGVLASYRRPARLLREGREIAIPAERIFEPVHNFPIEIPDVGRLEAYPNGDALHYAELYGLGTALRDLGRYTLRWPGHCAFWRTVGALGFLRDEPIEVGGALVSPRAFMAGLLAPQLRYGAAERDLAILRVQAWGRKGAVERTVTLDLVDRRDPATGLFAMNRAVGYTASIGVQLIAGGEIAQPGLRSPARDVPVPRLLEELAARGMRVTRREADARS